MARVAGVDLPRGKRVEVALTYIYGIGVHRSGRILGEAGIDRTVRVKDLSEEEVEPDRRRSSTPRAASKATCARKSRMNIKRLMEIGSYRGLRHRRNLPVRGQRTHTNARTRKGPRRTVQRSKPIAPKAS